MDLYSGIPFWIVKNPLNTYFHPLISNYSTDVIIIGSGITGALVAHELCTAGIKCAIVDKRDMSTGSSAASTALLQYEIDTPLHKLAEMYGEVSAVKSYEYCLQSITDLENIFKQIRFNPDFKRVSSIYYASNRKGLHIVEKEYKIRKKNGLPVEFLGKNRLYKNVGIKAPAALKNNVSGKVDAYKAATGLIEHHIKKNELKVFTNTKITCFNETPKGYELLTENGSIIKCKYVVVAAGFEAEMFLPKKVMKLTSTYAVISEPVDKKYFWPEQSLIWETAEPYLYIRTAQNRILVGGEDEQFKNPVKRDRLMRSKVKTLEKKFGKLLPDIPFKTDFAWCGTFSTTDDGLPFIGNWPGNTKMFYALGYGGNGITFSVIAAQLIKNKLSGIKDEREDILGFGRLFK